MFKSIFFAVLTALSSITFVSCGGNGSDTTTADNGNGNTTTPPFPASGYAGILKVNTKNGGNYFEGYANPLNNGTMVDGVIANNKIVFGGYFNGTSQMASISSTMSSYDSTKVEYNQLTVGDYTANKFDVSKLSGTKDFEITNLTFDDSNTYGFVLATNDTGETFWGSEFKYTDSTYSSVAIDNYVQHSKTVFYMVLFDTNQKAHLLKSDWVWNQIGYVVSASDGETSLNATIAEYTGSNSIYSYTLNGTVHVNGNDYTFTCPYYCN